MCRCQAEEAAGLHKAPKKQAADDDDAANLSGGESNVSEDLFDDLTGDISTQPASAAEQPDKLALPSTETQVELNEEEQALLDEDWNTDVDGDEDEEEQESETEEEDTATTTKPRRAGVVVCVNGEHDIASELHKNPSSLPFLVRDNTQDAAKTRAGGEFLKVQIRTKANSVFLPEILDPRAREEDYVNLTLRVEGGNRDLCLTIRCNGTHQTREVARHAWVVFQLGSDSEIQHKSAITSIKAPKKWNMVSTTNGKTKFEADLTIIYNRVIVAGVGNADGFDANLRRTLKALASVKEPQPGKLQRIDIRLHCWDEAKCVYLSNMLNVLQKPEPAPPNFHPYRIDGNTGFAFSQARMPSRKAVWEADQALVKVSARDYFPGPEYATMMLTVGLSNEILFVQARSEHLQDGIHEVAFQFTGVPGHGYAFIRADVDKLKESKLRDHIQMPRNNESLTIGFQLGDKKRKISGVLVPNYKHQTKATFVLHIDLVPRDFEDYASLPDLEPDFRPCRLIIQSSKEFAQICHALKSFYTNSCYSPMNKVFLGQRLDQIEAIDPTSATGTSDEEKAELLGRILKLMGWNSQQINVLQNAFKIKGGVMILQGPAGVGKTDLLAALAMLYVLCGCQVTLLAKTHPATNNLLTRIKKFFKDADLELPARFFQTGNEERWLSKLAQEDPRENTPRELVSQMIEEEHIGETTALEQDTTNRRTRRFQHPEDSFAQRAIDKFSLLDPENAPQLNIPKKGSDPSRSYPLIYHEDDKWDEVIDRRNQKSTPVTEELYEDPIGTFLSLQKRYMLPHDHPNSLSPEERGELFHLVQQLLKQVAKDSRCIATTLGNTHQKILRQAIGHTTRGNCIVIIDEASMALEAKIVNAIVSICTRERMIDEFNGDSFIKGIILAGDAVQDGDLLFNKTNNEFLDQLRYAPMTRLRAAGHPTYHLDTQYRTHEFISDTLISPLYYGGNLSNGSGTSATDPGRQFGADQVEFLTEFFKAQKPLVGVDGKSKDDASLANHHEQRLHLRLLNVVNAKDQVTPQGSKVNEMFLDVYLEFLVEAFLKARLFNPKEWLYMTPYSAELKRLQEKVVALLKEFGLGVDDVPRMVIADSAQGFQYPYVIYDMVTASGLGFLKEDRKFITHSTRGMNAMWLIGSCDTLTRDEKAEMERLAKKADKRGRQLDKRPILIQAMDLLEKKGLKSDFITPIAQAPDHFVSSTS